MQKKFNLGILLYILCPRRLKMAKKVKKYAFCCVQVSNFML